MSLNVSPTGKSHYPLLALRAKAELERRRRGGKRSLWPEVYTNTSTGKQYQPHNEQEREFVYNDVPRYCLIKGGEGCVAAETKIGQVPIAEITEPIKVNSVVGSVDATSPFLKGKSDLYRVLTQSGREVVVTAQHRFLTPLGWYQLNDLRVGDVIGSYDNENVPVEMGKAKGFQGDCLLDSRSYDELSSPAEWVVQSKLQQLHRLVYGNSASESFYLSHPYRKHFSFHGEQIQQQNEFSRLRLLIYALYVQTVYQNLRLFRHKSHHQDSDALLNPSEDCILSLEFEELLYQIVSEGFERRSFDQFQDVLRFPQCCETRSKYLAPAEAHISSDDFRAQYEYHSCEGYLKHSTEKSQEYGLFLFDYLFSGMFLLLNGRPSPPNNNTYWDKVQDIRFEKYGDFYDITVPFWSHYEANGIIHHNSGKTVSGTVKILNRLRRGMNGACVSPDFEHFRKSLWPEMKRWIPWQCVIDRHQYRQSEGWQPSSTFTLVFHNELGGFSELMCGGAKESEIEGWRGPNISFLHFDESSRHNSPVALKLFDGRVRITGPNGEPGQIFMTTTPKKNWLFDYFGPLTDNDKYANFKADSFVATVLTEENKANLEAGFVEKRAQSLTEQEIRVLLRAEWEDVSDIEKFVNITWWDACQQPISPMTQHVPMVIALDAAKGGETNLPDCFAMVGVSRAGEVVQVRYCGIWTPNPVLDFEPIENELVRMCQQFSVLEVAYDPYQLHDMATRLKKRGVANFKEFSQGKARLMADKQLQDLIMSRRMAHDGNPLLRQHIDNANIKKGGADGVRIVKRSPSLKVDAAVALSMAAARIAYFNV